MEDKKDSIFDDEMAFTDLMSRSERKEWERVKNIELEEQEKIEEQKKFDNENKQEKTETKKERKKRLKEEKEKALEQEKLINNENTEIEKMIKDEEPLKLIESAGETIDSDSGTNEIQVGELSKTKIITDVKETTILTNDNCLSENIKNEVRRGFNPIPLLGFIIILGLIYLGYIIFNTEYVNSLFLIINGSSLLILILIFCISTLLNKKHMKILSIINVLFIVSFIIFNISSILNWNWYEKSEETIVINDTNKDKDKDNVEKITINNYLCNNSENSIEISITEKNGFVTHLKKIEVFESKSIAEEIKSYFEDKNGFTAILNEETLLTEYDFDMLDINQYKLMIKSYYEAFKLDIDFSYISEDKILYNKYKENELKEFNCIKKES